MSKNSKHILFPIAFFLTVAILSFVGCQKEKPLTFSATTQSYLSPKVHFNGGAIAFWDNNDNIAINGGVYSVTIDGNGNDNNKATIAANDVTPYGDYYYAAYPAERATVNNAGTVVFVMPNNEIYTTNDNGNQLVHNTMVAKTTNSQMAFQNMCAMLHFRVKGNGSGSGKKLISIEVSADKPLAGNLTVDCNNMTSSFSGSPNDTARTLTFEDPYTLTDAFHDFYIQIPAISDAEHFRVCYIIEDGSDVKVFEKTKSASTSFSKGHLYHFGEDIFNGSTLSFNGTAGVSPLTMDGSASHPYLVSSEASWDIVKTHLGIANKHVKLLSDISVGSQITSQMKATLDGNGHTITLTDNISLFSEIYGGTVKNLTIAGEINISNVLPKGRYGSLVCYATNGAVIENCTNKANITCFQNKQSRFSTTVGGLCAYANSNSRITGCTNKGSLTTDAVYVGGIAGGCNQVTSIDNCINTKAITVNLANGETFDVFVGGVVGDASLTTNLTVNNCHNSGKIILSGSTSIQKTISCGGVFGHISASDSFSVNNCSNTGSVNCSPDNTVNTFVGGIAGQDGSKTSTMTNCFNEGDISASGTSYAGGLLGKCMRMRISNCYAYCDIAASTAAGIVGDGMGLIISTTISNCYYFKDINAATKHGIASNSYSSSCHFQIEHCFYKNVAGLAVCGTNGTATDCSTVSDANDNNMLDALNNNKPANGRSWRLGVDHIVFD